LVRIELDHELNHPLRMYGVLVLSLRLRLLLEDSDFERFVESGSHQTDHFDSRFRGD